MTERCEAQRGARPTLLCSRPRLAAAAIPIVFFIAGCGGSSIDVSTGGDGAIDEGAAVDAPDARDLAMGDRAPLGSPDLAATSALDLAMPPRCTTRVTYGSDWIRGANHPAQFDDTDGAVTWDGVCTDDANNSYALLSNGWKPYFNGHGACTIALDQASCPKQPPACSTRITYGTAWMRPQGHAAQFDDVAGRVYSNRECRAIANGTQSQASLSNGWTPTFTGGAACALSLRYEQCDGLYTNPIIPMDCPDPGVLHDGGRYFLTCTSGNASNAFPIRVSTNLVDWSDAGHIFPSAKKPAWATGDFWAPEIHKVGAGYVAYFTARHGDGKLSVGAATAASPAGPFTDLGAPLVHDLMMGMIDPTEFEDANGVPHLAWKADGNAVGKPTPIYGQALAADGRSLTGPRATLITNDQTWEGPLVEGPWVVRRGGTYFLFYSGNAYYNASYAVGVARAAAPLGPYTKMGGPILTTDAAWIGPGHCSVVDGPHGGTVMVYHAWRAGHVNGNGDARVTLADEVVWGAWPSLPEAPGFTSRPMP